jgi:hypothetical protein
LRITLPNTKKRDMTIDAFFDKMKGLGDELSATGQPVMDAQMMSYVATGHEGAYDSIVSSITTLPMTFLITVTDSYTYVY